MAKMTPEKLAALQQHDKPAFDFNNPEISAFFERALPHGYTLETNGFAAHPGFFQAPHRRDIDGSADVVMVGCPLDLGAIGLAGARHGPEAIRAASRHFGPINDAFGSIPFEQCSVIDYGDVEWSCTDLTTRVTNDIAQVFEAIGRQGCLSLSCGGEHTTTYGVLKGLATAYDDSFGLLHIDAHCDTMSTWGGDEINDGSVFRRAVLDGFIDPQRCIQIGIRGRAGFLWEFSHDVGMTVITADEVHEKGCDYISDQCREVIGSDRSYLSLDIDSLDSSVMMGTTGPEPFGLTARQVRHLIHGARGLNLVGADLVELNPNRDPSGSCAHLAAALFFELLSVLTDIKGADAASGVANW